MVGLIPMTGDTETFDFTTTLTFTATLAWLDGGKRLAGACWEKVVYWELPTRKMIREVPLEPPIRHIAIYQISPDGRYVAAARRPDGTVRLYDAESGRLVRIFAQWMDRNYAVFTPDGHYIATPGAEQELLYAAVTDQGPKLLTADEFARKYRWKNSPQKLALRPTRPTRGGREP